MSDATKLCRSGAVVVSEVFADVGTFIVTSKTLYLYHTNENRSGFIGPGEEGGSRELSRAARVNRRRSAGFILGSRTKTED